MPFYYRWYFRTGSKGDFEYLVTLLKPQPVDTRVGTRDMDVQDPGSNIPGITDPTLGGVLQLGGALRGARSRISTRPSSQNGRTYENWDQPYPRSIPESARGVHQPAGRLRGADRRRRQRGERASPASPTIPIR